MFPDSAFVNRFYAVRLPGVAASYQLNLQRVLRNEQYSFLVVMSELSIVRCDRVLGL